MKQEKAREKSIKILDKVEELTNEIEDDIYRKLTDYIENLLTDNDNIIYPIAIPEQMIQRKSKEILNRELTDEEIEEIERLIVKGIDYHGDMTSIAIDEALKEL